MFQQLINIKSASALKLMVRSHHTSFVSQRLWFVRDFWCQQNLEIIWIIPYCFAQNNSTYLAEVLLDDGNRKHSCWDKFSFLSSQFTCGARISRLNIYRNRFSENRAIPEKYSVNFEKLETRPRPINECYITREVAFLFVPQISSSLLVVHEIFVQWDIVISVVGWWL